MTAWALWSKWPIPPVARARTWAPSRIGGQALTNDDLVAGIMAAAVTPA